MNAAGAAMQDTMSKLHAEGGFLEKAYCQLTRFDPQQEAEYEAKNKVLLDICNKAMWAQKKTAPTVKANEDDKRNRTVRIRPELKPDELSHESMLVKFRSWLVEFSAYYYGSNMQYDDLRSQQGLFLLGLGSEKAGPTRLRQ